MLPAKSLILYMLVKKMPKKNKKNFKTHPIQGVLKFEEKKTIISQKIKFIVLGCLIA